MYNGEIDYNNAGLAPTPTGEDLFGLGWRMGYAEMAAMQNIASTWVLDVMKRNRDIAIAVGYPIEITTEFEPILARLSTCANSEYVYQDIANLRSAMQQKSSIVYKRNKIMPEQQRRTYRLVKIIVRREYYGAKLIGTDPNNPNLIGKIGPKRREYGINDRIFTFGWDFPWQLGGIKGHNKAVSRVTLSNVPVTIREGEIATITISMDGSWENIGYGVSRDRIIELEGETRKIAKGIVENGQPSGKYYKSIIGQLQIYASTMISIKAQIYFGSDHRGEMNIDLQYAYW
jgi:hypothetical protein